MSPIRQYELVYITPPDTTDEALAALQQQVQTVVDRFSGTIASTENWGRRRLAYEIAGHREGIYVLHVIDGPAALNSELDRRLRVLDVVIRHMVVRVDEELGAANRAQARRKADMAERRTRRGLPPEPTETERRRHAEEDDDSDMGLEQGFRSDRGDR
jgi:small subunit ribosomal protein S6